MKAVISQKWQAIVFALWCTFFTSSALAQSSSLPAADSAASWIRGIFSDYLLITFIGIALIVAIIGALFDWIKVVTAVKIIVAAVLLGAVWSIAVNLFRLGRMTF